MNEERRIDRSPKIASTQKSAAVELAKLQAELDEVGKIRQRLRPQRPVRDQHAQSVDDDRRIAQPMEKIVRIWIIGSDLWRRQDGAGRRPNGLPEMRPLLDEFRRGYGAQHRRGGEPILPVRPIEKHVRVVVHTILVGGGSCLSRLGPETLYDPATVGSIFDAGP